MNRKISVGSFGGPGSTATIIIDKNGFRIEDKCPSYEPCSYFIRNFISNCINMDGWQHSWHVDVSKAQWKGSEERKKVRQILLDKIETRKEEIQQLKDAIQVLGRWH